MASNNRAVNWGKFFWQGVIKGEQMGTLIPSQKNLIDRVISKIPQNYSGEVLEIGAGDGCITKAIYEKGARVIAVEINPALYYDLRDFWDEKDPAKVRCIRGDARYLERILSNRNADKFDYIISSLPLSLMDAATVNAILGSAVNSLSYNGIFTQYQYTWAKRLKPHVFDALDKKFNSIQEETVWLHVPPSRIYHCTHPSML